MIDWPTLALSVLLLLLVLVTVAWPRRRLHVMPRPRGPRPRPVPPPPLRPHAAPAERRLIAPCEAYGHLERMTSVGRGGYVAQFVCERRCGWTALRKGAWRWPA